MRLGISGTYSSGKTLTAMALSYYTGVPRTRAKTMREILPEAVPGKTLEECTAAELLQMIVVRHVDRAVHESRLADGFISDGSSLQEWIYGSVRVLVGINPNASAGLDSVEKTPELRFFEDVIGRMGVSMKQHVKRSFDGFVHLRNELPLSEDGHRPVNDRFRSLCDSILMETLDDLAIPYAIVSGTVEQRLEQIAGLHGLPARMTPSEAAERALREYATLDTRVETER
jgi:AAA domain-containing protein